MISIKLVVMAQQHQREEHGQISSFYHQTYQKTSVLLLRSEPRTSSSQTSDSLVIRHILFSFLASSSQGFLSSKMQRHEGLALKFPLMLICHFSRRSDVLWRNLNTGVCYMLFYQKMWKTCMKSSILEMISNKKGSIFNFYWQNYIFFYICAQINIF